MASSEEWRREDEGPVGRPAFEDVEAQTASSGSLARALLASTADPARARRPSSK